MATPAPAQEPEDRSAFERFEDLTRRLLTVPKAEVDARRKKAAQERAAARKPSAS